MYTKPVASSHSSLPVTSSPKCFCLYSGSLIGMLGDEQGNQTLSYTSLETLRPYFCLLHASCSHFLFCLVVLLPSLPARSLSLSSEPSLCSLLSSSLCLGVSLCRESVERPGRRPVLLQPLLLSIHLFLARSLSSSLSACPSFPFIALHHISCVSLSALNSFSMLHTLL